MGKLRFIRPLSLIHFSMLLVLLASCAGAPTSTSPPSRRFFLAEEQLETHGRKTWYDRIIEADPGGVSFVIAGDYQERPPRKIAVLPFVDKGTGSYLINKIPAKTRDKEELDRWSWTHTNRVRRALAGDLGNREFIIFPLLRVDAVLANRGITDTEKLNAVAPEALGRWLDVDALVYGELLSYESYYGFLFASWKVSARVRIVSTEDGREIFSCTNRRYTSTVNPAISPIDMVINSFQALIHLRDISLARTEYEVGREIVMSLPRAERNISEFLTAADEGTRGLDSIGSRATALHESGRIGSNSPESVSEPAVESHP